MNTKWTQFQSTLLIRGATNCSRRLQRREKFQSTLLIRGATRFLHYKQKHRLFQSTLLIRGATLSVMSGKRYLSGFQSTLLIRGATRSWPDTMRLHCIFQSTLLIRGATLARLARLARKVYFNPRSSYEERRCKQLQHGKSQSRISIHAPHTRSDDLMCIHLNLVKNDFNPRSSYEERHTIYEF